MSSCKPNFLIVGAAKSGTTSLYEYLKVHPQIYMPEAKEPLYFISEIIEEQDKDLWMQKIIKKYPNGRAHINKWNDYIKIFKNGEKAKAVGEASATYLYYYNHSIPKIIDKLGDIKIIIILRNPIEKAFSQYKYLKRGRSEPLNFKEAIKAEKDRIDRGYCFLYHYTNHGLYYEQVKAFLDNFKNVKVILNEQLNTKPEETIKELYKFLEVDINITPTSYEKHNVSNYIPKNPKLNDFFNYKPVKYIRKRTLNLISPIFYQNIRNYFLNKNSIDMVIPKNVKEVLMNTFWDDINKLEKLLNIDLSSWKKS